MSLMFLGVGNLHRADDGVGPYMAQHLAENDFLKEKGVEVLPHSGEGASLMHLWEDQDFVVIVDCMKTGSPLGTVQRFDAVADQLNSGVFRYSSHLFGLAEAVEMSRKLETLPPKMIIYGVEGVAFAFEDGRSPEVEAAVAEVEAAVLKDFAGA